MEDLGTHIARDHTKVNAWVAWVGKMGNAIFVYVGARRGADGFANRAKLLTKDLCAQSGPLAANGLPLFTEFTRHLARSPTFPECGFLVPVHDELTEKECK